MHKHLLIYFFTRYYSQRIQLYPRTERDDLNFAWDWYSRVVQVTLSKVLLEHSVNSWPRMSISDLVVWVDLVRPGHTQKWPILGVADRHCYILTNWFNQIPFASIFNGASFSFSIDLNALNKFYAFSKSENFC